MCYLKGNEDLNARRILIRNHAGQKEVKQQFYKVLKEKKESQNSISSLKKKFRDKAKIKTRLDRNKGAAGRRRLEESLKETLQQEGTGAWRG